MIRITEKLEDGTVMRLRLDGTLSDEQLVPSNDALSAHRAERIVILDLGGVDFMSDGVARALESLRGENLRIINCSPFISALLDAVAGEKFAR